MLLLLLLLLLLVLLLLFSDVVAVAVGVGVADADEDSTRRIPSRADFGPTWDRAGSRLQEPPIWQMTPGRRPG